MCFMLDLFKLNQKMVVLPYRVRFEFLYIMNRIDYSFKEP